MSRGRLAPRPVGAATILLAALLAPGGPAACGAGADARPEEAERGDAAAVNGAPGPRDGVIRGELDADDDAPRDEPGGETPSGDRSAGESDSATPGEADELHAIAEAHPEAPTPEQIDALLADPALHRGRMPEDGPPPLGPDTRPTAPAPPRTHPKRRALGERLFDALRDGDLDAVVALTPAGSAELRAACPELEIDARELRARFTHCQGAFDWSKVAEATVNGGEPTADQVEGCASGLRAHARLRVQVRTESGARHDAELRDVVGREGEILGFLGTLTCVAR